MHFPSEGYHSTEIVLSSFLLLVVLGALRLFRRTLGDRAKDDLDRLHSRYARGLLSFEQYQREKAKIRQR